MRLLTLLLFVLSIAFVSPVFSQKASRKTEALPLKAVEQVFSDAAAQYKVLMKNLPADSFPKTFYPQTGRFEACASDWWVSGFYPGTLLYLFEQTGDSALYREAVRSMGLLQKEQFNKTTHDLGFMMYCSFGNALRIAPQAEYKHILINSARSLASRFNPKVGCIKSWDSSNPDDFLVIIDNMMNLELLFWAAKATGDRSFYNIAVTHANSTLKNHFRPDHSSFHVLNYDALTGAVKQKRTAQGAADSSAWARGQGWGLYGFTLMYRETKDPKYLEQAKSIAGYILSHPRLPADKVPYWDFDAPGIPDALRDASAGAVMASALLELGRYVDRKLAREYFGAADTMLRTLSSPQYRAATGTNGGFILVHSVGSKPGNSEVDVPLTYADYYFVEALMRYKKLKK
jgi:unsaturated chondroitin disaccharide hydrolase